MQYLFILLIFCCPLQLVGFSISKISSHLTYNEAWKVEEPEGMEAIFSQPFSYLKAGSQSYAFVSQDGKYVIKFFRMSHFSPCLRDFFRPKRAAKKRQNLNAIFGAYKLAFESMREDTGLVYLHLNKTSHLQKKLTVSDQKGKLCFIDLDKTEFVIQEKAELIFSYLKDKDPAMFDAAVSKVLQLIDRRSEKHIFDYDYGVSNNFGFVGDRPIQIDIGRIYQADLSGQEEKARILQRINVFRKSHVKAKLKCHPSQQS